MANCKVIAVANQKGGVGKSTSVYCIGAGLAMDGKRVLLVDVDPQGDLTKMLGQRKPHELTHTLAEQMNAVVQHSAEPEHPEILHHHEGFDFVPANRSLSAVEVGLVNVMSRETVLKRYLDGIKKNYDYVLLDCRPSLGMLGHQCPVGCGSCTHPGAGGLSGSRGHDGTCRYGAEHPAADQPKAEDRRRLSNHGE